ncbi:hypothetical protein ACF0H5_007254 [Mactra antiquata]
MEHTVWGIPVVLFAFNLYTDVKASCTKPSLNTNSLSYTDEKNSYALNETYQIFCVPGYITSDSSDLICVSPNQWSSAPPECTPAEGTYPWWMLLVAVSLVILVVACILPRFLACCLSKTKKKKPTNDVENGVDNDDVDDSDSDDENRRPSPTPDFSRQKNMNNMEFMQKLHEDVDKKTLKRATKNATF